jgi:hypothetical protein
MRETLDDWWVVAVIYVEKEASNERFLKDNPPDFPQLIFVFDCYFHRNILKVPCCD